MRVVSFGAGCQRRAEHDAGVCLQLEIAKLMSVCVWSCVFDQRVRRVGQRQTDRHDTVVAVALVGVELWWAVPEWHCGGIVGLWLVVVVVAIAVIAGSGARGSDRSGRAGCGRRDGVRVCPTARSSTETSVQQQCQSG